MGRRERGGIVLIRAAALLALVAGCIGGCIADLPEGSDWIPIADHPGGELAQPPAPAAPGQTLRVATFNVELAPDPDALAAAIAADDQLAGADVILIQEIEAHTGEPASRAARLAAALELGYVYAPAREIDGGTHGLAILSRHPIADAAVMKLPRVDLPVRPRHRIALTATIAGVRVIDLHLDTRINVTERILQLRPAVIDLPPDQPVVVGGDLNTNPYRWAGGAIPDLPTDAIADTDQAPIVDDYMRALGFATPTAELGPTQDAIVTRLRLDALYPRGVDAGAAGIVRSLSLSDHWPLWVDVSAPTSASR